MSRRKKHGFEFSKKLMLTLTVFNASLIVWAFILYSIGVEIPSEVVVALITGWFGEFLGYLVKAFKSKKEEENIRLIESGIKDINEITEFEGENEHGLD